MSHSVSVLFIGGTGTISASCVRLAVAQGLTVTVLNRGGNAKRRALPEGVEQLTADVTDDAQLTAALEGRHFDAIANFLSFSAEDAARAIRLIGPHTDQYVHISTASMYQKPILHLPITESTPRHNPFVAYSRSKIAAEDTLLAANSESGFPVTIVRPSHTYDEANPPLPGGWTDIDRLARGLEVPVTGDGTSLWTLTHAADFAQGFVGLLGNPRAVGETFHITSDDVYTWDQIYTIIAGVLGVEAKLVHVPADFYLAAAPEWGWSELLKGDLGNSAVFDNSKIRGFVPGFRPERTFHRSARDLIDWRDANPAEAGSDAGTTAILDRIVTGYHTALDAFRALNPAG